MRSTSFRRGRLPSPLGALSLVWDGECVLRALDFEDYEARLQRLLGRHYGAFTLVEASVPTALAEPLGAFFAGEIGAIDVLSVGTNGTAFQRRVWRALRGIPAGRTRTYGELAAAIGAPSASRAVGLANGANPIAIVVPCHRVIGVDGTLTGYGGGIARKRWLLDHERRAGA
ncbi:MAG: methylated-DNA--[protein]-cysteine S-methyltransferase [Deltaproteobacteria bacterium]|nr:methylated-DNA--[protein]-cysteine S-methyltransferase [Deltaproteobacteria bacterium]